MSTRAAHLFVAKDFNLLNKLLSTQENKDSDSRHKKEETSSHIWLVHIEQDMPVNHVNKLSKIFMKAPLRLDSLLFAFFESDKGTKCVLYRGNCC